MKKVFVVLTCFLGTVGFSQEVSHYTNLSVSKDNSLSYVTFGACCPFTEVNTAGELGSNPLIFSGIDIALGRRHLFGHHAVDYNGGVTAGALTQGVYGQSSYLYYPVGSEGPYVGAGFTMNVCWLAFTYPTVIPNIPLTVGYQTTSGSFYQVQYGCRTNYVTASYGMAF